MGGLRNPQFVQQPAEPIAAPDLWLDYFLVQTKDLPLSVASRRFLQLLQDELWLISSRWNEQQAPARMRKRAARG